LVKPGVSASVSVPEQPRKLFPGKVVRVAGALNAESRTLRTEVQIPNKEGKLLAGTYCELHFSFPPAESTILIPSNDIIFRADGIMVAVVDAKHRVHLQQVKLGRDFGSQIEILDGLKEGDKVVENPGDSLHDGTEVEG
jgi:RND family efflux transporter MFP subunit